MGGAIASLAAMNIAFGNSMLHFLINGTAHGQL